jgi:hypothetical protein
MQFVICTFPFTSVMEMSVSKISNIPDEHFAESDSPNGLLVTELFQKWANTVSGIQTASA